MAGAASSIFNWILVLPLDNIKTQLQAGVSAGQPENQTWLKCLRRTVTKPGGIANLYRGWDVLVLRSFPANLVCLLGYQLSLLYMKSGLE